MFKKNLVALAVMATVSTSAFAKVEITPLPATFVTTTLASVTKQPVLSFSTAQQDVTATFTRTGELKQNGFITLELTGDATFNAAEVRQWLTSNDFNALGATAYDGIQLNAVKGTFKPKSSDTGAAAIGENLLDVNGAVIKQITVSFAATYALLTDAEKAKVIAAGEYTAAPAAPAPIAQFFKTEDQGTAKVITHAIDQDGKRLRLALVDFGGTDQVLLDAAQGVDPVAGGKAYLANTALSFNLTKANQVVNIKSGAQGVVELKVGALRNASYTADPQKTPALFKLDKLFALEKVTADVSATALVAKRFAQLDVAQADVSNKVKLVNKTTNQNIQLDQVKLSVEGNFTGFSKNTAGDLLDAAGTSTGWKVVGNVATRNAGVDVLEGNVALNAFRELPFTLAVTAANVDSIEAQEFAVKATILGSTQDTFNDFSDTLAKFVLIKRDGMKFDTITTGTTAANLIFVRDISKILPETGGKIFVTITEYDAHGVNGRGAGTTIVERKELTTTLPSGGAVTLSPTEVALEVGAATTPGRQARFVFEVETNQGEVAVRKATSEGTDIQNGTKGVQIGNGGNIVDFTL